MKNINLMITLLFASSIVITCTNKRAHHKAVEKGKQVVLRLEADDDNPRNSEGDFVQLEDGKILYVYTYFISGGHDHDPAFLAGRYSTDKGRTWTSAHEVILANEGASNIMSVSLLRLNNGEIALFYLRKNSRSDCVPMMRISNDEAATWEEPITIIADRKGYFTLNNDRVVQLDNGRLLVPVGGDIIANYYSDDNGRTWLSSEAVPNPNGVRLEEPGVVALKSGRILMFIRTDCGVQFFSYSEDRGQTWSPVEAGNIPSPRSPATIQRIPSTGDLLLVWNNKGFPIEAETGRKVLRTPFNSAISTDDGETWSNIRFIGDDPHTWYNYPSVHFIDDGLLLGHNGGYWVSPDKEIIDYKGVEISQMERKYYLELTKLSLDWIYGRE